MKTKTTSSVSGKLLRELHLRGISFFTVKDAAEMLSSSNLFAVRDLLAKMVSRGLLLRIRDGLYNVIPYEADPDLYFPDWHLTAKALANNNDYYIGYFSALQLHSLTTQPSLKEQIVLNIQKKPSMFKVSNVRFQFIYHNKKHFFGYSDTWINDYEKVMCSDIEKTIIDSLYRPKYSCGLPEISKAIITAGDKINKEKLFEYALKFKSGAVIKRLGFLYEALGLDLGILKNF